MKKVDERQTTGPVLDKRTKALCKKFGADTELVAKIMEIEEEYKGFLRKRTVPALLEYLDGRWREGGSK